MTPVTTSLLDQMVQAIVDEVDPDLVILFGSRARGDHREDSDVDLMVIELEPFGENRSRRLESVRLWRALSHFVVPKDIVVYSRDEVQRWRGSINHLLARTFREGKVLYERHPLCGTVPLRIRRVRGFGHRPRGSRQAFGRCARSCRAPTRRN